MIICTMTTASHVFRAKVMANSAKRHHPDAKVVVCLIEKTLHPAAGKFASFDHVLLAKDLGIPNFDAYLFKRNVHEASFALKGHFLKYLFRTYPSENEFVFIDTDIQILSPLNEVREALRDHSIVLTPHEVNDAKESYYFHGIFNIGFIALSRTGDTGRFLDWWISRVDRYCYDHYQNMGLFYEQTWLDMVPALFDTKILMHPGYNVAFWNLRERGQSIAQDANGQYTVLGQPLRFFHFSNMTGALVGSMKRFIPNEKEVMYKLFRSYLRELKRMGRRAAGRLRWSYDYYANGLRVSQKARALFREDPELENKYPNPYQYSNRIFRSRPSLRIVQVVSNAPDAYPVPPVDQGGTEKVVYELTEELVKRGHQVYLYAARGSSSSAKLIPYPSHIHANNIGKYVRSTLPPRVDIIHDHTFNSAISRIERRIPTLCTQHITRNYGVPHSVYVSKRALEVIGKNKGFHVYNGIDPNQYEFSEEKRDYLLFIGRIIREKGIMEAIDVAERSGQKLIIAGPLKDKELYENEIQPRIKGNSNIEYVGTVGGKQKQELIKHARCVLFPILWEEPFGLVMIEAMACGTPVIALANGSVPEIMAGFPNLICTTVDEMVQKVLNEPLPDPYALRDYVTRHFTNELMADRYLEIYEKIRRKARRIGAKKRGVTRGKRARNLRSMMRNGRRKGTGVIREIRRTVSV